MPPRLRNKEMPVIHTSEEFVSMKVLEVGRVDTDRIMAVAGISGFPNPNYVLCYMNAVLQCILRCKQFTNPILNMNPALFKGKLSISLYNLIQHLASQTHEDIKSSAVDVFHRGVYNQIREISPMFGENEQQDAQEFLLCATNAVMDEFDRERTEEEKAASPRISFECCMRTEVVCCACGFKVPRNENFMALTIPASPSIPDSLNTLFAPTLLTGKDRYACENCFKQLSPADQAAHNVKAREQQEARKHTASSGLDPGSKTLLSDEERLYANCIYQDAEVSTTVTKLGGSLAICILRFQFDLETQNLKKIRDHVHIPLEIDLSPYVNDDVRGYYNSLLPSTDTSKTSAAYKRMKKFPSVQTMIHSEFDVSGNIEARVPSLKRHLVGIVAHKGTLTGGHYVAYVRHLAQPMVWFRCDDEIVTIVELKTVMMCIDEVYLAFYE